MYVCVIAEMRVCVRDIYIEREYNMGTGTVVKGKKFFKIVIAVYV